MNTQMSQPETNSAIAARIRTTKLTPHICVCICTFRRPELLNRLLGRLLQLQKVADLFTLSCVVVDNDEDRSAAEVVSLFENSGMVKFIYQCEPERNFAVVRNRAVRASSGDYIAFIDDDEIPERDWLLRLLETCERYGCDGALGAGRSP